MSMSARERLEMALSFAEQTLVHNPRDVHQLAMQAELLTALGHNDRAKQAYVTILQCQPGHLGALLALGTLHFETGYQTAARAVFDETITRYPNLAQGYVGLGRLLLLQGKHAEARIPFERAIALEPANAQAHQGLSGVFQEEDDLERMMHHRALGFAPHPMTTLPFRGAQAPIPLLVLVSNMGGDLPWTVLVDDHIFETTVITAAFFNPAAPLPPHALVFNAIGDTDGCEADLIAAEAILRHSTAPLINPPALVRATGRVANAARLRELPGVLAPRMATLSRAVLERQPEQALAEHGIVFPLLLRRPGFHTGRHFLLVDGPEALAEALACIPGEQILAIEYLDTEDDAGDMRKYRVMMIDGHLYPLHLAISSQWKVHYFSAEMAHQAAHQAEEKVFLDDMPGVLGAAAMQALKDIQATLGLDYAGVDFSLDANGQVVVYEANATMLIAQPEADAQWDYRRPAYQAALDAARRLLLGRAAG